MQTYNEAPAFYSFPNISAWLTYAGSITVKIKPSANAEGSGVNKQKVR